MITQERLKKLIEQKATIYETKYGQINTVDLKDKKVKNFSGKYVHFVPYRDEKFQLHKYYDRLFETKEEAEWQLEFGNITRTEKLSLPTFEEITASKHNVKTRSVVFYKNNHMYILEYAYQFDFGWGIFLERATMFDDEAETLFQQQATKENYLKACKMAKKLFLGEAE